AEAMGRMRIAELLGEVGQHRCNDAWIGRRRRLVVEIDRPVIGAAIAGGGAHAALARRRSVRATSAPQASMSCAMSPSFVSRPRLMRMAVPARAGGAPIAARTWLSRTLPDEQAAPALTMTPARSSAITCVAAGTPG